MTKMLKAGSLRRIRSDMFTTEDAVRLAENKGYSENRAFLSSRRGRGGELLVPLVEGTPIFQGSWEPHDFKKKMESGVSSLHLSQPGGCLAKALLGNAQYLFKICPINFFVLLLFWGDVGCLRV